MKMKRRMGKEEGKEEGKDGSRSVLDLLFIPIGALIEHVTMTRWTTKSDLVSLDWNASTPL